MDSRPIIIVGAPRSGTSLLQKILRECPGCGAVPRESQHIWGPHAHPSRNDWDGEFAAESTLRDQSIVETIRCEFRRSAIAAAEWHKISSSRLFANPVVRRIGRLFPSQAVKALTLSKSGDAADLRLVEKSVHAGLWLPLVDAVFPNALYIHLVRDPRKAIPSIMSGWNEDGRFVSFDLPRPLAIEGYMGKSSQWCFPLPRGWREYADKDLLSVGAFQWRAINESIVGFFRARNEQSLLRIRLEDLIEAPGDMLARITTHCGIDEAEYFRQFESALPVINKGPSRGVKPRVDEERLLEATGELARLFDYV